MPTETKTNNNYRIQFYSPEENGHSQQDAQEIRFHLLSERDNSKAFDFIAKVIDETPEFEDFILTGNVESADMVLLYALSNDWAIETAAGIRSQPDHFLKPVLLSHETPDSDEKVQSLVDITLNWPASEAVFADTIRSLSAIAQKVDSLPELSESLGDIGLKKIQLLRYFYSRDPFTLRPLRNFQSSVGYSFGLVHTLSGEKEGQEVALLENLEEAQLLNTKLVDKVNVCPYCGHSQINFRELCPACRSLNIHEETTIHHFRCAYVGKESAFRQGFKFSCPKCSRELRHIGVDYDKPSDVLWCSDCNHNFPEPLLSCFCLVCAHTYSPEDVFIKQINEYSLSQEGYRAAEEGAMPGFGLINILKKELGFYKYEVFMEYLRIEVFRCRRYKYPSTLARFSFKNSNDGPADVDILHSRKLKNDFAALLKETFRTTDLLTDLQEGDILIVFTNTPYESSKIAFNRLNDSIKNLLKKEIVIHYKLLDLAQESDELNDILEKIR